MDNHPSKTYRPTKSAQVWLVVFVLPGTLLIGWLGTELLQQAFALGVLAMLLAALLCVWTTFILTSRITLTNERLMRTWWGGTHTFLISEITKLQWGGARGQLSLTVRTGKAWVSLSSLSFKKQELREMADAILVARDLKGQPLWPPYATYIDVDAMAKRKAMEQQT